MFQNTPVDGLNYNLFNITKPTIIAYMSVDENRQFHPNLSQLKYLAEWPEGNIYLDLSHNIEKAVKRTTDNNDEKITLLLKCLVDRNQFLNSRLNDILFITYRRTLISLMCKAFDSKSYPLRIVASLFNNAIYLCSVETPQQINQRKTRSDEHKKYCAWGYKFEQYLLSDQPFSRPNIERPVIENEEFSIIYKTTYKSHHLVYCAQIDGMLATETPVTSPPITEDFEANVQYLQENKFVELKTNKEIHNRRQEYIYKRHKLLECWCQCYLADLCGLFVGFRNDEGIIQRLQWYTTEQIVDYCKNEWNPKTALEYLDYSLNYIKKSLESISNKYAGSTNFDPISVQFDFDFNIKVTDVTGKPEYRILPDWYTEAMKSKIQN